MTSRKTMTVTCNANEGRALSGKHFAVGNSAESRFDTVVGKTYEVFGIALWMSLLHVLVVDESSLPNWLPIELFSITEPAIPTGWFFSNHIATEHGVEAIWGYKELATDASHYERLLERDSEALSIFHARQRQ